jgi:hypothetical protein
VNQMFKWRRAFERGELVESCALLPVTVSASDETTNDVPEQAAEDQASRGGAWPIFAPARTDQCDSVNFEPLIMWIDSP